MPESQPWLDALIGTVAAAASRGNFDTDAPTRIAKHVYDWSGHLTKNAIKHWIPGVINVQECNFCESDAVSNCIVCGASCCLAHCYVRHNAEVICDECAEKLLKRGSRKKKRKGPGFEEHFWDEFMKEAPPSMEQQALEFFGLDEDYTDKELRAALKEARKKYHPDTKRTNKGKAAAEKKFKQAQEFFDILSK